MAPSEPAADEQTSAEAAASPSPRPANMLAHISMHGDVAGVDGEWIGEPGSPHAIEAVMLAPAGDGPPQRNPGPEYQILYGDGVRTPWTPAGQPCGSRGYGLAALGIRFRLSAETASFFDCRYDVAFTDGSRRDGLTSTEVALAPPGAKLAAFRLHVAAGTGVPLIILNDIDVSAPPPWPDLGQLDQPFLRLRLLSPSFVTAAPTIRNAALIPAESWAGMNVSFRRTVFPGRTITLREVGDATVVAPGLVFDRDLNLVPIADYTPPADIVAQARETAAAARDSAQRLDDLSLFCRTLAPENYGHALIEAVSKAWLAREMLGQAVSNFILQASPLLVLTGEALRRAGIVPAPLTVLGGQPVLCSRLLLIDGLTDHGIYQSPLCLAPLRQMSRDIPAADPQKLFVSRPGSKRRLLNQDAIETVMRDRGFAVVDPGRMSLSEQIALFKGATVVVGALGAALTNIAFCEPGTRVVALSSNTFPDTFFWFLAQHAGLRYEEVRGRDAVDGPVAETPWESGFTLADDDLAYLAAL